MSDENPQDNSRANTNQPGSEEAWHEVGRQFQQLGDSLSQAFRTAWQDEKNRQTVEEMRGGLEALVKQVGDVIHENAGSEEGHKLKEEAVKAAHNLRDAGEQTVQEVRPQLVTALRQVNIELQKLIDSMDRTENKQG